MSKGFIGSIIFGCVIAIAVVCLAFCTCRVPTGMMAVQYSVNGGLKDETLSQGWHLVPPTVKTSLYPVSLQQSYLTRDDKGDSSDDESFEASSSEGKALDIDLTFSYQFVPERIAEVFNRFGGQNGKSVRDSFIKPNIISWTKEVIATFKVADILGESRANVNIALTEYLAEKFEEFGIKISNASLINIGVDKETTDAINAKITATQNAETQAIKNQTEIDKAKADAEVKLTQAQAEADAKLIQAEAEAKANEKIQKSLTQGVLESQWIEKWDGVLPEVTSDKASVYFGLNQ